MHSNSKFSFEVLMFKKIQNSNLNSFFSNLTRTLFFFARSLRILLISIFLSRRSRHLCSFGGSRRAMMSLSSVLRMMAASGYRPESARYFTSSGVLGKLSRMKPVERYGSFFQKSGKIVSRVSFGKGSWFSRFSLIAFSCSLSSSSSTCSSSCFALTSSSAAASSPSSPSSFASGGGALGSSSGSLEKKLKSKLKLYSNYTVQSSYLILRIK